MYIRLYRASMCIQKASKVHEEQKKSEISLSLSTTMKEKKEIYICHSLYLKKEYTKVLIIWKKLLF
jgi:hypothetical protein